MKLNYTKLYQNHGTAIGYWEAWTDKDGFVTIRYAKTLDGKAVEKPYQAKPKNVGRANETTAYEQAVSEINSKAKKKIDKGYVATLEEAKLPSTNSMGFAKPMLATPLEDVPEDKIDFENAFAQRKLDGHRTLHSTEGEILYSRGGKEIVVPHVLNQIKGSRLSKLPMDGELYVHGLDLNTISSLVKKNTPESLRLSYFVYDLVMDIPFKDRQEILLEAFEGLELANVHILETTKVVSLSEAMLLHNSYRAEGYEGTILRFGDDPYKDGKRSRKVLKIKDFKDEEFKVIGYREGTPYITPDGTFQVPVWLCETMFGTTFEVTAAGTMREKHLQFMHADSYIGRLLTVKFHYYSEFNVPQLPVAMRWRVDL